MRPESLCSSRPGNSRTQQVKCLDKPHLPREENLAGNLGSTLFQGLFPLNWAALERGHPRGSCSWMKPVFGEGEFITVRKALTRACVCVGWGWGASLRTFHKFFPWDFRRGWFKSEISPIGQPIRVQGWDPFSSQASSSDSLSAPSWEWKAREQGWGPNRAS